MYQILRYAIVPRKYSLTLKMYEECEIDIKKYSFFKKWLNGINYVPFNGIYVHDTIEV